MARLGRDPQPPEVIWISNHSWNISRVRFLGQHASSVTHPSSMASNNPGQNLCLVKTPSAPPHAGERRPAAARPAFPFLVVAHRSANLSLVLVKNPTPLATYARTRDSATGTTDRWRC